MKFVLIFLFLSAISLGGAPEARLLYHKRTIIMENISPNVSYIDSVRSRTAIRLGIENTPNDTQLTAMKTVALKCYEPIVAHYRFKIPFASFFRCPELNEKIGGSENSQHTKGEAMDLDADGTSITNRQLYDWIKDNLDFDQLIFEHPDDKGNAAWVHVSYREGNNRKQCLIAKKVKGKTVYVNDPL